MGVRPLANGELLSLIRERWFRDPRVDISVGVEGVRHDPDAGTVILGCRAGSSYDVVNLLHEMAHFVEIPEERCVKPDWGFRPGKAVLGDFGIAFIPTTARGTEREARVWAWQTVLMREIGVPFDVESLVGAAVYMSDFTNVPGRTDAERVANVAHMVRGHAADLSIDGFDAIWNERVSRLGILFDRENARLSRMAKAYEGEVTEEVRYFAADGDPDVCVVLRAYSDGGNVAYEVCSEIGGVMEGEGPEGFEDRAKAERFAKSLFDGREYAIEAAGVIPSAGL